MLIEAGLLRDGVNIAASTAGGVALAFAIRRAPWSAWLADGERQWVWFGSMALLLIVWAMKAGLTPGLSVRFLLVTALTLMHGWHLAVVAGALVLAVLSWLGIAEWTLYGTNLLCMAVVPALFTAWWHEQVHARPPLMSFGEAVVNGMIIGMAVVYRPRWVMSFDDRLYLAKGR